MIHCMCVLTVMKERECDTLHVCALTVIFIKKQRECDILHVHALTVVL